MPKDRVSRHPPPPVRNFNTPTRLGFQNNPKPPVFQRSATRRASLSWVGFERARKFPSLAPTPHLHSELQVCIIALVPHAYVVCGSNLFGLCRCSGGKPLQVAALLGHLLAKRVGIHGRRCTAQAVRYKECRDRLAAEHGQEL